MACLFLEEPVNGHLIGEVEAFFHGGVGEVDIVNDKRAHAPQRYRCKFELLSLYLQ